MIKFKVALNGYTAGKYLKIVLGHPYLLLSTTDFSVNYCCSQYFKALFEERQSLELDMVLDKLLRGKESIRVSSSS